MGCRCCLRGLHVTELRCLQSLAKEEATQSRSTKRRDAKCLAPVFLLMLSLPRGHGSILSLRRVRGRGSGHRELHTNKDPCGACAFKFPSVRLRGSSNKPYASSTLAGVEGVSGLFLVPMNRSLVPLSGDCGAEQQAGLHPSCVPQHPPAVDGALARHGGFQKSVASI